MSSVPQDPTVLYLYHTLSSGSSTINTAYCTLDRILKAHKVPFVVIDVASDDKARSIWTRRRKSTQNLPALVRNGDVIGDYKEVEEWNEYGELKQKLDPKAAPPAVLPQTATTTTVEKKLEDKQAVPSGAVAIAAEAAAAAKQKNEQKK